jgi:hypothetical protein
MAAVDPTTLQRLVTAGALYAKYATPIDRASAHEIITARIQAAAAASIQQQQATPDSPSAPPQVRFPSRTAQTEARRAEREAQRAQRQAEKERAAAERARQRTIRTSINTAGRVLTSRTTQTVVRGILGTLFGGKR